jgi:hypothetical protein
MLLIKGASRCFPDGYVWGLRELAWSAWHIKATRPQTIRRCGDGAVIACIVSDSDHFAGFHIVSGVAWRPKV